MMNAHVLTYLLGDAWTTGAQAAWPRRKLKAEAERRRPAEILDAFLDLVAGVKRFEIVSHLRDRVCLLKPAATWTTEDAAPGLRLYEFGESAQVLNNAVNATVLFLDLRGFTADLRGPDLRARPHPRALRRLRRLRAPRAALRGHGGQVPGRRHHGHLRHRRTPTPSTR